MEEKDVNHCHTHFLQLFIGKGTLETFKLVEFLIKKEDYINAMIPSQGLMSKL